MYTATEKDITLVENYLTIKEKIAKLSECQDEIADSIKARMAELGVDEMNVAGHAITHKAVTSKRLDAVALKKFLGEDSLEEFMKVTNGKRFVVK